MEDTGYVLVCAIDFGTTYSGYAFSTKATPNEIFMNKNWGAGIGYASYKNPTCVLTTANGEFKAFGFDAEQIYAEEIEEDEEAAGKSNLFRQFKMILHSTKKLSRETKVKATNGREARALDIFVYALKYLKDHMLNAIKKQVAHTPDIDIIRWVLTVPAIWTEESKQFMREAAFKAGCISQKDSRKLVIALEPEAASLCCRRLEIAKYPEDSDLRNFIKPHTRYLIIDCGGGTVDITSHEILPGDVIRELHAATGGPWGGTKVDERFVQFLKDILGAGFIESYQQRCPQQWLTLMIQFERMKKTVSLKGTKSININVNMALDEDYKEFMGKGHSIEQTIKSKESAGVKFKAGVIVINADTARTFFKPVIQQTIQHIKGLLEEPDIAESKYFFLVGGFSESPILQDMIKGAFSKRANILVPSEAQMTVVKGAVMFGHRPNEIKSRIARQTYGCKISRALSDMDRSEYTPSKVITVDGRKLCDDVFSVFVSKNEDIEVGELRSFNYSVSKPNENKINVEIYSMDRLPRTEGLVDFVDDQGVQKVGQFVLEAPGRGAGRKVHLEVTFGGTEIQIEAESAGKKVSAEINFLAGQSKESMW